MLEGFTKDELFEKMFACQKKYEKLEVETIKKAITGEIGTNSKMVEELESLNKDYLSEMELYDDSAYPHDLTSIAIGNFKQAEEKGINVIQCAKIILGMNGVDDEPTHKLVFKNEDGQICDEYGTPLSEDGEHRVFDVIKGGKCNK